MNTRTELSGFVKSVLLLFIAFTMIEGSSITEKITGVDAGVSATTHRMMGAAHAVRGASQFGMQVKQMSMLKNNTEAMKQMQGGNGMSDENSNDGTGGMPGNDNGQGASDKPNQSDPDHNSSNINNKEDIDNQETNGMQMNETSAMQGDTNMQNSVEEKNTDSAITATEDAENGTDQNFAQMDQAIGDADDNNTGWDKGENKAVEAGEGTMFERWEAKQSDAENMRESMQNLDDIGKTSADLPKKNADRSRPRNINNGTSYNDTPSREKEHPTKFSTETIGNTTYVGGDGGSEKGMFGRASKRYTDYTNGKEKK